MNPTKQRIAIAQACGWKSCPCEKPDCQYMLPPGATNYRASRTPPDYLTSLDAMHDAEKAVIYADGPESDLACDYLANLVITADAGMSQSATAAQRSEAFLRTLNLWNDND